MKYIALLRGINVGGKNKVPMSVLKECLEELGYQNVITYINSGNVIFETDAKAQVIAKQIENILPKNCTLDTTIIRVLVLTEAQLVNVVRSAPKGFGKEPNKYHCDVVFLFDVPIEQAYAAFDPHPEVDAIWKGKEVIYFQRLSAKRTKSRLSKIISKPIYKNMTIRNWNTTTKLLAISEA